MSFFVQQGPRNQEILFKINNYSKVTERAMRHGWFAVGQDLKREANAETLKKNKRGRLYRIKGRKGKGRARNHRASAPSQTHANMFGDLRRAISWKVSGADLKFGYGVSNRDAPEYGKFLEFGTRRMKARPTLRNSIRKNIRNTQRHLETAVVRSFGSRYR